MKIGFIIIQAGGKGTRLAHLTRNKPKGIVPVNNLPMIFHLMNRFKDKKFIVIADYKSGVMQKYLDVFSPADFFLVKAEQKGTCAGISDALKIIPSESPFMLVWSDLILGEEFSLDGTSGNAVGISGDFPCRWSYKDGIFSETPSSENGVAGLFVFSKKSEIADVPQSGEFVKWLGEKKMKFETLELSGTKEVGTLLTYEAEKKDAVCRPFNSIEISGGKVTKRPVNSQGEKIAEYEINWYKKMAYFGYKRIPEIFSYEPLQMEKIDGKNVFAAELSEDEKKTVIKNLVAALKELHSLGKCETDFFSLQKNYVTKTFSRINKVRDMIPFADEKFISVNGKKCKNVFFFKSEFKNAAEKILYDTNFTVIHGDCTFSNSLVDKNLDVIFIDPRGYFGDKLIYGDENYDWAKLYYSVFGNYDQFNRKNFQLEILERGVNLSVGSSGFEDLADFYLSLIPCKKERIELLHAIIWLSLSTYAWEDYDSVCAAFYNGIFYLDKFI